MAEIWLWPYFSSIIYLMAYFFVKNKAIALTQPAIVISLTFQVSGGASTSTW